jgi:hypothetical protein
MASYHSQKRGAGGRASLGVDDLVREIPNVISEQYAVMKKNMESKRQQDTIPQSPSRNFTDPLGVAERERNGQSQIPPEMKQETPHFISTAHEPAQLVYAPLLAQPALAKAQLAQALEAVNQDSEGPGSYSADRQGPSAVLLPDVNCQTRRSVNIQEQQTLNGKADGHGSGASRQTASGRHEQVGTAAKKQGKQSKFKDDYARVTGQGCLLQELTQSGGKGKKGVDRLHEDYRRALKAIEGIQSGTDKHYPHNGHGPYACANLQPYLASIGASLIPNLKDRALTGPYAQPEGQTKQSKGVKGLHHVPSKASLGRASQKHSSSGPGDEPPPARL